MTFRSTKTYGADLGLSTCYRQWRADSHCQLLHGYALAFKFVFEAITLDERGWVVDFGGLRVLKENLRSMFDHKMLIARDDPKLWELQELHKVGLAEILILDRVGCEAFAELAWNMAYEALWADRARVRIISCEVSEHGANSAIYLGAT